MCEHTAERPLAAFFGRQSFAAAITPQGGSRRRRLWDLEAQCHCPVVGVCVPLDALRRLVTKAVGAKPLADDYEVHVGAVAECGLRNRLSELLQNDLDQRYARELRQFKAAKTAMAVAGLWSMAVEQGEVAGAFWAALTHPRCDAALQEVLCRDMHMLQHQAGARARMDVEKFHAVVDENAVLARELGKVQERSTRYMSEKSKELALCTAQLVQIRADAIAKDSRIAFLCADVTALKASVPGCDTEQRLQKRLAQMAARQRDLEVQNAELRQQLASVARSQAMLNEEIARAAQADRGALPPCQSSSATVRLDQKIVLCVGGRSGSVASYRDVIERVGGRFAHHDGGLENNQTVLDASLAAADLVICQTGCISHNAYWKVKDFCKRTGKRCVFVENPSTSSLVRGLEKIWDQESNANPAENAKMQRGDAAT